MKKLRVIHKNLQQQAPGIVTILQVFEAELRRTTFANEDAVSLLVADLSKQLWEYTIKEVDEDY